MRISLRISFIEDFLKDFLNDFLRFCTATSHPVYDSGGVQFEKFGNLKGGVCSVFAPVS